jgi:hypothetical protein
LRTQTCVISQGNLKENASSSDWKEQVMKMTNIVYHHCCYFGHNYSHPFATSYGKHYISHFKTAAETFIFIFFI